MFVKHGGEPHGLESRVPQQILAEHDSTLGEL